MRQCQPRNAGRFDDYRCVCNFMCSRQKLQLFPETGGKMHFYIQTGIPETCFVLSNMHEFLITTRGEKYFTQLFSSVLNKKYKRNENSTSMMLNHNFFRVCSIHCLTFLSHSESTSKSSRTIESFRWLSFLVDSNIFSPKKKVS